LARYGRPRDQFRIYELNPEVIAIAGSQFTFLADSQASTAIVEGDARLRLTGEPPQRFDLLLVDAFSSDSIPVHLLTAECSEIYRRHIAPGGWLLFHISNHTLNLEPVVRAIAARLNWAATKVSSGRDVQQGTESATWVILDSSRPYHPQGSTISWTDSFAAVWSVLK
jgi:spermidine synthase